jgi:hypothetical protein
MAVIKINTQTELDEALKHYSILDILELQGSGTFIFRGSSAPRVVAWGSSAPRIVAWGSSAPTVIARESSAPTVIARDSSALKGRIGTYAGMILALRDKATSDVQGDNILRLPDPKITNAQDWCSYYGVPSKDGIAILFKGVNDDYSTNGHTLKDWLKPVVYSPGATPKAEDWNGAKQECGGGLHFNPSVLATLKFHPEAKRFMACPVRIDEIVVHPNGQYPNKVKAPRVVEPGCFEVDRDGEPIKKAKAGATA